jgi:diketogulonate reductase-like aldo/keto reductase
MNFVTLNNGLKMPQPGFGVWQVADDQAAQAVANAIKVGYRFIDTAMIYKNEKGVGQAIAESSVPRDELFITTKVWNSDQGFENTLSVFDESLERLGLDYVDLYLIHWPTPQFDQGGEVLQDEVIQKIATSYSRTSAQVVLRWHLQNNTICHTEICNTIKNRRKLSCI